METIYFEKDGQLYQFDKIDQDVIMPEKIKILTKKEFEEILYPKIKKTKKQK